MQAESKEIAVAVEPRCGVEDFECFQIGIRQSDALETLGPRADQTKYPGIRSVPPHGLDPNRLVEQRAYENLACRGGSSSDTRTASFGA